MLESFREAGVGGQILRVIDSFFTEEQLSIQLQDRVVSFRQNNGTPQGNPLSCLAFVMLIRDLEDYVRSESRAVVALYADDTVLAPPPLNALRRILPKVSLWLKSKGLEIKRNKTKVMRFCKSGRLSKTDSLSLDGHPLEFVKTLKYLGLISQ